MSDAYGDYDPIAAGMSGRLVPEGLKRLAGAVLFLGLVSGLGLWAYRLGTRDAAEVPIIRAMEGPSRIQPEEPGGLRAAHQGLEVNAVLAGQPAPTPAEVEAGAPAVARLAEEDGPQGELIVAEPAAPMDVEMTAAEDLRMPPADEGAEIDLAALAPVETPPPAAAPPVSATEIAALVEAVVEPQPTAAAPVSAEDAPRPMRRPSDLVVAHAARAAEPASAPAVRTPAAAREVATVPAGSRGVQLGAYDSEAITREAWERLVTRYGDLLGDKSLYVERTTANARVFYRLRVAGFSDTEQTRQMCEALRARGVDCIPVTLR